MSTIRELMAQIDDWAGRKGWKVNGEPPKAEHYALAYLADNRLRGVTTLAEDVRKGAIEDDMRPNLMTRSQIRTVSSLCLIATEIVEAIDAFIASDTKAFTVNSKPEGLGSELADVIIRTLQLGADLGLDLQWEIERKMNYNEMRPFKHGKKA